MNFKNYFFSFLKALLSVLLPVFLPVFLFLFFLLFFQGGGAYAEECKEAFPGSGELFSDPSSFAKAMTRGLILREGQDHLFQFYLKNWTPYPNQGRGNDRTLQDVFDTIKRAPDKFAKIPLRDYIFEFSIVKKEMPQSLNNFIKAFKSKSHRVSNNLFNVEENIGFWIKMLRGNTKDKTGNIIAGNSGIVPENIAGNQLNKKALKEERKKEREDFIAWLDTTALNKDFRDFIKDPEKPYKERVIALYKALEQLKTDFLNLEQATEPTQARPQAGYEQTQARPQEGYEQTQTTQTTQATEPTQATPVLPPGNYEKAIQNISQAQADLIYGAGFQNKLWMDTLKGSDPEESLNTFRSILTERDNIAFELGFKGHFTELKESLNAKVPNDRELLLQITEDLQNQAYTIQGTETLRLRSLSLQESPFRSCMGGDCATSTYFEKALDPNFIYFTLTDNWHRSSGQLTLVLGEALNQNGQKVKTAFVDKIQNIDTFKLKAVLEALRLSLKERDYTLALPKKVGDHNGLSNDFLINDYVDLSILPNLKKSLKRFKPHKHNLLAESENHEGYSRAYKHNLELLEFEGVSLEQVNIRPGDFPVLREAHPDLSVRSLYQQILSFEKSTKNEEQMQFLSNFLILREILNFSNLFSREHLYSVMENKAFSFNVRKRAFYTLIEIEPKLQAKEKGETSLRDELDFTYFEKIILEDSFFSEGEKSALLGEMSNWKGTSGYRKKFITKFTNLRFIDNVYKLSRILDSSPFRQILDKDSMFIKALDGFIKFSNSSDTAQHRFAREQYREIILTLLEKGVDPNVLNDYGATALGIAGGHGHIEAVRLLLEKGADINFRNDNGATALMIAGANGHTEVARLLLERGADPNIPDRAGRIALILAGNIGHPEVVRLLLESGAELNFRNNDGATALLWASLNGHTEVVRLLLESGADPNIPDRVGSTALIYSSSQGHNEISRMLLEKGVDINVRNNDGATALMFAGKNGKLEAVRLLLESGAELNFRNNDGATALMIAEYNRHPEVVQLLQQKEEELNTPTRPRSEKSIFTSWLERLRLKLF